MFPRDRESSRLCFEVLVDGLGGYFWRIWVGLGSVMIKMDLSC